MKQHHLPRESWGNLLGSDSRPWLLASGEAAARWITLTHLLERPNDDPEVRATHRAVMADPGTQALIAQIPAWDKDTGASGHASPRWSPNILLLLADMGCRQVTTSASKQSWTPCSSIRIGRGASRRTAHRAA